MGRFSPSDGASDGAPETAARKGNMGRRRRREREPVYIWWVAIGGVVGGGGGVGGRRGGAGLHLVGRHGGVDGRGGRARRLAAGGSRRPGLVPVRVLAEPHRLPGDDAAGVRLPRAGTRPPVRLFVVPSAGEERRRLAG